MAGNAGAEAGTKQRARSTTDIKLDGIVCSGHKDGAPEQKVAKDRNRASRLLAR
jgi:hypothetical protein